MNVSLGPVHSQPLQYYLRYVYSLPILRSVVRIFLISNGVWCFLNIVTTGLIDWFESVLCPLRISPLRFQAERRKRQLNLGYDLSRFILCCV